MKVDRTLAQSPVPMPAPNQIPDAHLTFRKWSDLLPLVLPPLNKRVPVVADICERLVLQYRENEWLPAERHLSQKLGVSRTSLREAIQRLEIQGLLEVKHGIGVRVVDNPSAPVRATLLRALPDFEQRLRQFAEARVLIEPELARRAAINITDAGAQKLTALLAAMEEAGEQVDAAVRADLDFHRAIADLAGNRVLALMIGSMAELEEEARRITLARVGFEAARLQHQRIVEAIVAGDEKAAHATMLAHVLAAQRESNHSATSPRHAAS